MYENTVHTKVHQQSIVSNATKNNDRRSIKLRQNTAVYKTTVAGTAELARSTREMGTRASR
jgi:hypothetical protein